MDRADDNISPLRWHCQLQYHWWVDAEIIFTYQKLFLIFLNYSKMTSTDATSLMGGFWHHLYISKSIFYIPKLLWDDISICNITDGWILTSSLDIQMCFLVFLNLTKLSPDQKMVQIWYHRVPTVYIIIFNSKNNLIWLVMSSMLYFFPFRSLEKLELEILDFGLFT